MKQMNGDSRTMDRSLTGPERRRRIAAIAPRPGCAGGDPGPESLAGCAEHRARLLEAAEVAL